MGFAVLQQLTCRCLSGREIQTSASRVGVGNLVELAMQRYQDNTHIQEQGSHLLKKLSMHGAARAVQAVAHLMHHSHDVKA
jgi:hypothetical protein